MKALYLTDFESDFSDDVSALRGEDLELTIVPAELALVVDLPVADRLRPYLGIGAGYYNIDVDNEDDFDADFDVDDQVGWFGTAGLALDVGGFTIYADAQFRQIEGTFKVDEFSDIDDDEFDFDTTGWGVTAGLLFNW